MHDYLYLYSFLQNLFIPSLSINRHNPNNLLGIEIGKEIFKGIPQIAVFDTAFHTTIPEYAHTYAIPKEYREKRIRKYGFHGTSVKYVSKIAIERLKQLAEGGNGYTKPSYENESKLVIAHLGNGASVTAVVDGKVRGKRAVEFALVYTFYFFEIHSFSHHS